jgi:transposase-like protein
VNYPELFKEQMVRRMVGPGAQSATSLSEEVDIPQPTLSKWLREAPRGKAMSKKKAKGRGRRPQDWSAEEKLEAVMEASKLSEEELGAFLRRKGLHEAQLEQWRKQAFEGAQEALSKRSRTKKLTAEKKKLRELEREVRRKDKALAEATALLVLKKKLAALWGDEDDDTHGRNES